jgi:hypothetical protein
MIRTGFKTHEPVLECEDTSTAASTYGETDSGKDIESLASNEQLQDQLSHLVEMGTLEADARIMLNMPALPRPECEEALQKYAKKFGGQPSGDSATCGGGYKLGLNYSCPGAPIPRREVRAELEQHLGLKCGALESDVALASPNAAWKVGASAKGSANRGGQVSTIVATENYRDDDGELVALCHQCYLPLGTKAYMREGKRVHSECMAQLLLQSLQDENETRLRKEHVDKQRMRKEYNIGWSAEKIPRNAAALRKLESKDMPDGMVCLVLDEKTGGVRAASTTEPSAAVNLEYLSIALQVRRQHGHEPIFSLEQVEPGNTDTMQAKVFIPEWLEGTSVGEVMFQADYHLKELSMGEYEQPVVGMKSCFDYSEMKDSKRLGVPESGL